MVVWRKTIVIFLVSIFIGTGNFLFSQSKRRSEGFKENHSPFGRRKKERSNQNVFSKRKGGFFARLFSGRKSRGNAESFANHRIIGKHGFFSNFRSKRSGNASLRRTKTARREDRNLFHSRNTKSKISFRKRQVKQSRRRERNRKRGNVLFSKRKR
ncbi:MAG: hypothetical protein ACK5D5_08380 [Bacteroidota bacterium]|jgi:hypothetical protein